MRHLINLTFILFLFGVNAQSTNTNALSYFGLGERASGNHAIYDALGQNNFNFCDSAQLNFFNPASYSLLSAGNTLFSIGIQSRASQYSYNNNLENKLNAMVDHFALGFKMKKRMGLAFGLKPFTSRGYSFSQKVSTGLDSIKYNYIGTGGIQDLFLGFSFGFIQNKRTKVSVGGNISYLFGTVSNERQSILVDANTSSGGLDRKSFQVKSLHYELGFLFRQKIASKQEVTFSGILTPSQNLNATYLNEFYSMSNLNSLATYDTLNYEKTTGKITYGLGLKYGVSYQVILPDWKRNTRTLHPQLTILASYSSASKIDHNFDNINSWNLSDSKKTSLGIQFSPESKLYENIATLRGLEKLSYRIGAYQSLLPYVSQNGSRYEEAGVSFGIGMPILAQQGLSSLNLALTLGTRGNSEINATQEKFIGLSFGLIVSPSSFDRWFRKRKLD